MSRLLVVLGVFAMAIAVPAPVAAHSLSGRLISPLPLVVYLAGAAIAVGLSFLFVMFFHTDAQPAPPRPPRRVPRWLIVGLRAVGLIAWLWIVAQLVIGGSSEADVGTLFLWTYGWVGVALVSALAGPVWVWLNPFATLFDLAAGLARRFGLATWQPEPYPERLGSWPAVLGLFVVIWLELASFGVSPGVFMVGYTIITLALMAQFGRDEWLARGETFSVWFATLGRLAPFRIHGADSASVQRRDAGAGLFEGGWSVPAVVLVALGTGSILYDGLSQTTPWFDLFGLPDVAIASLLLTGFLALVVAIVLAVGRLVSLPALGAGLLPIAVGYLLAHYLTFLLADGQRLLVALSDPFQLGWDLLGTAFFEPDTSWLPPSIVWTVQLCAVVGGHVVGAWAGHAVAARTVPNRARLRRRELPLAVLMVLLTTTTLWSLGQAVVVEPSEGTPMGAVTTTAR